MTSKTIPLLLLLTSCAVHRQDAPTVPPASETKLSLLVGQREYDEEFWAPVESQTMLGVHVATGQVAQEWRFETGLFFTEDTAFTGLDLKVTTQELSMGVLWESSKLDRLHPYVGGGLTYIRGDFELSGWRSESLDDSSIGGYLHGGVAYELGEHFEIGVDFRTVFGTKIDAFVEHGDFDYVQAAFTMGWRF